MSDTKVSKFKIGDKAVCINANGCSYLTVGREYIVSKIAGVFVYILADDAGNTETGWLSKRFELVNEDIEEIITKQYKTKDGKVFESKEDAEGWLLRSELQTVIEAWHYSPISDVMDAIFTKYEIKRKGK